MFDGVPYADLCAVGKWGSNEPEEDPEVDPTTPPRLATSNTLRHLFSEFVAGDRRRIGDQMPSWVGSSSVLQDENRSRNCASPPTTLARAVCLRILISEDE